MIYPLETTHNESDFLLKNVNESFEITNFSSKIMKKNNNFYYISELNNIESSSEDESFNIYNKNIVFNNNTIDPPNSIKNKTITKNLFISKEKNKIKKNNNKENQIKDSNYEKKNIIFDIKKTIKLGRIKKLSKRKGKHDKYKRDNIIRKFKVHLIKNVLNFINSCFLINKNFSSNDHIKVLKKLSSFKIKLISKEENLKWLDTKLKYIFSEQISTKQGNIGLNFNKQLINRIYDKGKEKKVIFVLEKTVREMWNIYINGTNDKNFIGFQTLKDDLDKFKEEGETDLYIEEYRNISFEFEKIFKNIVGRRRRKE